MATLIWTEPAVADLEEIGQFISKDNPPAAEKVGSRIIREAENVAAFPRLGRIVPEFGNPQIREIISQSYRIIYKFDEEGDLVGHTDSALRFHPGLIRLYRNDKRRSMRRDQSINPLLVAWLAFIIYLILSLIYFGATGSYSHMYVGAGDAPI